MALALFLPDDDLQESPIQQVTFNTIKFNKRPRPSKEKTVIIGCFSEFGCETVGCLYCIPRVVKRFPGRYVIAMGWYGREYLYRHLVDEFWELDEKFMSLRDETYAFHYNSRVLQQIERAATKHGQLIASASLGAFAVINFCNTCGKFWHEWRTKTEQCPVCKSTVITSSLFSDPVKFKESAVRLPLPSADKQAWAQKLIKPNTVGIVARGRKTYSRNLEPSFYLKLIELVKGLGYEVVWLGEKQSCLPCPDPTIFDFSQSEQARDLERTLAIVGQCKFTLQFFTASSRLAGMMGTPYILFESVEQVYSTKDFPGQEGKRLELTTFGPKKVVISQFEMVRDNPEKTLDYVRQAISELVVGNQEDIVGLVENRKLVEELKNKFYEDCYGK